MSMGKLEEIRGVEEESPLEEWGIGLNENMEFFKAKVR